MKKIFTLVTISVLFFQNSFSQTGKDAALETLGATGGMLLYNTYVAIGAVGDAQSGKCYEDSTAI